MLLNKELVKEEVLEGAGEETVKAGIDGVIELEGGILYKGVYFKVITHPSANPGEYYVSEDSRVYNLKRNIIMKPQNAVGDYQHHMLLRGAKGERRSKKVYVHHLVAHEFIGKRPKMYNAKGEEVEVVIHHKDDNMYNNSLSNLEYVTHQTNVQLGRATKLDADVVKLMREANKEGRLDYELLSEILQVSIQALKDAVRGTTWTNV